MNTQLNKVGKVMTVKRFVYSMFLIFVFCLFFTLSNAQGQPAEIYVCVSPEERDEYLIEFRETNLFGLVIPEKANVTVYSNSVLSATVYSVSPDAITGGY